MSKSIILLVPAISVLLFSPTSNAQEHPDCWLVNDQQEIVDISYLCNQDSSDNVEFDDPLSSQTVEIETNLPFNTSKTCQFSWQRDAAGRLCGRRAANQRPGGN